MTSSRAEELAAQFEARHTAFVDFIESLTDAQWLTPVPDEQRTVASLAHHLAWGFKVEIEPFHQMALGNTPKPWTLAELDAVNADLGPEFAECDRPETVDLLNQTAAETAAIVRSLTDEQLARKGTYIAEMGERSVEALIERILLGHIEMHSRSIRQALGLP